MWPDAMVSAETRCENLHKPFPRKLRYGRDRGGHCDLGAFTLSAAVADVYPNRDDAYNWNWLRFLIAHLPWPAARAAQVRARNRLPG